MQVASNTADPSWPETAAENEVPDPPANSTIRETSTKPTKLFFRLVPSSQLYSQPNHPISQKN